LLANGPQDGLGCAAQSPSLEAVQGFFGKLYVKKG